MNIDLNTITKGDRVVLVEIGNRENSVEGEVIEDPEGLYVTALGIKIKFARRSRNGTLLPSKGVRVAGHQPQMVEA